MFWLIPLVLSANPIEDSCNSYNTSCLLCMQHADSCFFCFSEELKGQCVTVTHLNDTVCSHKSTKRDEKCVAMLGGDAVKSTRYIIGFTVMALGIIVDFTVRFCSKPQIHDEYAHIAN